MILHFDPGDIYTDNYVLQDSYDLLTKYNLDTVRFSFSKSIENNTHQTFSPMYIYPPEFTKIIYGTPIIIFIFLDMDLYGIDW